MKSPELFLSLLLMCSASGCKKKDMPLYKINTNGALYITADVDGEHKEFVVNHDQYTCFARTIKASGHEPVQWVFKLTDTQNHHKVFEVFIRNHDLTLEFQHLREELYATMDTNEIAFTYDPDSGSQFRSIQIDYYPDANTQFSNAYSSDYINNEPLQVVEIKDTVVNDVTQFIVALMGNVVLKHRESGELRELKNFRARIVLTSDERMYQ